MNESTRRAISTLGAMGNGQTPVTTHIHGPGGTQTYQNAAAAAQSGGSGQKGGGQDGGRSTGRR